MFYKNKPKKNNFGILEYSSSPNFKLQLNPDFRVVFVATRNIKNHEHLSFKYDEKNPFSRSYLFE